VCGRDDELSHEQKIKEESCHTGNERKIESFTLPHFWPQNFETKNSEIFFFLIQLKIF